jgi:hypothetical protein
MRQLTDHHSRELRRTAILTAFALALSLVGCSLQPRPTDTASRVAHTHASVSTLLPGVRPGDTLLLVFGAVDCPIANAYAPELDAIFERVSSLGWHMVYVYPDPTLDEAAVADHRRAYSLRMPACIDREHRLVHAVGATVTPEVALVRIGPDAAMASAVPFELLYAGRIDDRYPERGVRRPAPTVRDLRDAIESAAAGRPPEVIRTPAVGCIIEPLR